ncbi:hypothetical protein L6452_41861 [Arctium lappa]|uniref:Uncharacterized protein n=1 Tax=Arctium lappa TaxID=4217 RepID=A0ACB8XG40_ARCLA|nr:hypothetical protein L6452_41861 [Arctium lappa]
MNYGVKRMDLGGKALTNYLKELLSYRSINVLDETFLMDDVKDKLCFNIWRRGNDNYFRCTYVLRDGITHTKGFVKDPVEAQRCVKLSEDGELPHSEGTKEADQTKVKSKPSERNKVDLTKNEFSLSNERFLVPKMIFRPADLGLCCFDIIYWTGNRFFSCGGFVLISLCMHALLKVFSFLYLVFSSSATVYGWLKKVPCTEEFPLSADNPYGRTKV